MGFSLSLSLAGDGSPRDGRNRFARDPTISRLLKSLVGRHAAARSRGLIVFDATDESKEARDAIRGRCVDRKCVRTRQVHARSPAVSSVRRSPLRLFL